MATVQMEFGDHYEWRCTVCGSKLSCGYELCKCSAPYDPSNPPEEIKRLQAISIPKESK